MKVSTYILNTIEGTTSHGMYFKCNNNLFVTFICYCFKGNHHQLELCHEHKFRTFALSICKGNFGGVKNKEFICVGHINSTLSVFEQDGIVYESVLENSSERGIPTVFCYVPRIDSFVTVTASFELECYRYQDLVQTTKDQGLAHKPTPIEATWSSCVGEFALDITALQISK